MMTDSPLPGPLCLAFISHVRRLEDPRQPVKRTYPLEEIFFLGLFGVCCGCEGWDEIRFLGESRTDFLREYLPYASGIPSASTIARAFGAVSPDAFRGFFTDFFGRLLLPEGAKGLTIACDGKTLCGSGSRGSKALHVLHACVAESGLLLGYKTVDAKSNEIPVFPELLDGICVEGAVVTADAMGCQRAACEKIVGSGGDYVICLKGNQGTLHADAALLFADMPEDSVLSVHGGDSFGHGRIETRETTATAACGYLAETHKWPGLASVAAVRSRVRHKKDGKETEETRYFVSSLPPDAERLQRAVRAHWKVESFHWQLDVSFNEDDVHISLGNAAENLACLRRIALNLFKAHQKRDPKKSSVNRIQKACLIKPETLREILNLQNYLNANS